MASDKSYEKNSYVMYKSWSHMILAISDEQAGILFKAICNYQIGQQACIDDPLLGGMFEMFKASFELDDSKYRDRCEKNAISGSKGGRAKADNASKRKQTLANANDSKQSVANLADMDTDMDMDTDTEKEKDTDTETDTDKGVFSSASVSAPVPASASSAPAHVPKTENELMEICKREHINCNGTDIEYYFGEMVRKDWKDGSGNPIRSVPAHFRDWLKRNADTTISYCLAEEDYKWIEDLIGLQNFLDMQGKLFNDFEIEICIGKGSANTHTLQEFIDLLKQKNMYDIAEELEDTMCSEDITITSENYKLLQEILGENGIDDLNDRLKKIGFDLWLGNNEQADHTYTEFIDFLKEQGLGDIAEKLESAS